MTQHRSWRSVWKNRPQTFSTNIGPLSSQTSWTEELRSPLEADPADVADQRHGIPDDDERRGD
jgi:hypothetical protein